MPNIYNEHGAVIGWFPTPAPDCCTTQVPDGEMAPCCGDPACGSCHPDTGWRWENWPAETIPARRPQAA